MVVYLVVVCEYLFVFDIGLLLVDQFGGIVVGVGGDVDYGILNCVILGFGVGRICNELFYFFVYGLLVDLLVVEFD